MTTLMNLRFSSDPVTSSLYSRPLPSGSVHIDVDSGVQSTSSVGVSFDTYFNAFFGRAYALYTSVTSCAWQLSVHGDMQIRVIRRLDDGSDVCLVEHTVRNAMPEQLVSLPFTIDRENPGRIFIECTFHSAGSGISSGKVITHDKPLRDVSLGIVVCTYNRPAYTREIVRRILQLSDTFEMPWHLIIVDNAKNFSLDTPDQRVTIIPNNNIGGSGGFSLGMKTAIDNGFSHVLCMDDDIAIDAEVVPRLASIAAYCHDDMIVGGGMLNMEKPSIIHESGALHNVDHTGTGPLRWKPLFHGKHAGKKRTLDLLTFRKYPQDYQALWCCLYSADLVARLGLMMPYFIRQEDLEYSLRARRLLGSEIVTWPGIAVWQQSFESKCRHWIEYYIIRNLIITDCLHRYETYSLFTLLSQAKIWFLKHLYLLQYAEANMVVTALEDALRGPEWLSSLDAEVHHQKILSGVGHYLNEEVMPDGTAQPKKTRNKKRNIAQKFMTFLTLNGHMLPSINAVAHIRDASADASLTFRKFKVHAIRVDGKHVMRTRSSKHARKLFLRWVLVVVRYAISWKTISKKWHEEGLNLTSVDAWKKRFSPEALAQIEIRKQVCKVGKVRNVDKVSLRT